jgi:hypothetical protein
MFDIFTSRNVKKIFKYPLSHPTTMSDQIVGVRECWLSNLSDLSLEWVGHFGRNMSDLRVWALIHLECTVHCTTERASLQIIPWVVTCCLYLHHLINFYWYLYIKCLYLVSYRSSCIIQTFSFFFVPTVLQHQSANRTVLLPTLISAVWTCIKKFHVFIKLCM